ncbi:hypothetical protein E8E13_006407 [Curvularia kusanoi]|uniref:Uncharacterized protein n=1 Tax=Curvularia kusanoi TaxID=90978 RepID=A0A9P4WAV2_CURKU|nr:hypothetical protein E8E13_006407 [Curvularia kusanoi]
MYSDSAYGDNDEKKASAGYCKELGNVNLQHLPGAKMPADGLTKPLSKIEHAKFLHPIDLVEAPSNQIPGSNISNNSAGQSPLRRKH